VRSVVVLDVPSWKEASMKRLPALGLLVVTALAGPSAFAHDDPNGDGNRYSTTRCDTYYRNTHQQDAEGDKPKLANGDPNPDYNQATAHSEDHVSEFDEGDIGDLGLVYVHEHTGHYVVRTDAGYVEVIGGDGYNRDGIQGGFVQGEVDAAEGVPDADFHAGTYAGTTGTVYSQNACLSAADTKVGESGVQDPATYCLLESWGATTCTFTAKENGLRVYADIATGIKVLVKRGTSTIHNVNDSGPFVNESRSYAIRPADVVTCTLTAGSSGSIVGRMACSG
jgi:hypothetical protein